MIDIMLLLIIFQVKHLIADYPLQTPYMLGKFKKGNDYILPLLAHVSVHALFTFIICIFYTKLSIAIWAAIIDAYIHFCMDRIKASPDMLGRFKALSANEMKDIMLINRSQYKSAHEFRIALSKKESVLKSNKYFWWSLGLDQMVHHLTHYLIIFLIF